MSATHLGTWTRLGGFTLPLLLLGGCGGPGDGDASSSQRAEITGFEQSPPGSRAVIIAPEKAMSFRKATGATKSGLCCGLLNWGDLDGDSLDDVIVAYARKSGLRTDLGWIEAWSVAKRERIWQVTGVPTDWTDRKNPIPGYALGLIAKIGDVDGDGIADVYCQEQFNKPVMLCSGRTGTMIERRDSQRSGTFAEPIRVQDADGDGAPDLWFVATHPPGLVVHATRGGKHVQNFALHWPGIAAKPTVTVAIPRFTDANSDGVEELLLYCMVPNPGAKVAQLELAIIDGASLQLLHRFRTPAPRVTGTTTHAAPGDLTGDGLPDIVKASVCGEGEEGRTSFLKLIDGSTGTVVWTVTGDKAGGVEGFAVNLKTKEKKKLPSDIEYGAPVLVVPDVNSDGAVDLATVCKTEGGVSGAVLVHSGSNGQLLGTIAPDSDRVRLSFGDRTQLALLENTTNGAPQIVATGRSKERTAVLAVFELPGK